MLILIKKKFAENIIAFLPSWLQDWCFLVWIIMEFLKSHYFQVLFLITLVLQPVLVLIPMLILAGFYLLNFKYLKVIST
jgi:hypothetical protein